ncbi:MAG: isoleucine--tRNA ligase [Patescibacteria group bacterium]
MKKVESQVNFPKLEEEVLRYWEDADIFQKSISNREGKEKYRFYDGPPFATGLPHYGHFVPGLVKDVFPRYKTMRGYQVERQWGWDCHGLPIENIVEKELGFKNKKDILEFGVEKFNDLCRTKVLSYAKEWEVVMKRFGRFVDMEHAYHTMDVDYMESIWWVWKSLWEKGLVYESYRTMHICPRCETTLSQQEVSEGYKDVKDLAVTAKFELVDEPGTYLLAWTTTPWTLPGNVALAINQNIAYTKVESEGETYIVAFNLIQQVFAGKEYQQIEKVEGQDLIGKSYIPPFQDYYNNKTLENRDNGWKIYHADFVTTDVGTGIAHEAPAFGEDDMVLGKLHNLPWVQHVRMDGTIKDEVTGFAGSQVKPIENPQAFDVEIIKSLATKRLLFSKEKYEHSYPHCWRCDTPLLNYATSSWFVAIEKIKELAIENAKEINWSPEHIKNGRFGKWLEGARDWSVSRQRFWASCIPLWVCECGEQLVIGSRAELKEKSGVMVDDLHKHIVDEVTFPCACGKTMKRIPDVLDTWFDSGSMPYASKHYMGEGELEAFPANFIAEGLDQTRAWFYYLHVLSTALKGENAFENCVVNGTVLAEDGRKMSKKLNNYPDPMGIIDTYGADALRLYILSSPVVIAEDLSFSEGDLGSITRNTFRMLWNSYSFFTTYATIDNWSPAEEIIQSENIFDRRIISKLQSLIQNMTRELDSYGPAQGARLIAPFVEELSNGYIRENRSRFWKNENDSDKYAAYQTLYTVLVDLSKLMAPFTPFISEEIYRNLTGEESVHLAEWPKFNDGLVDNILEEQFQVQQEILTVGRFVRTNNKQPIKQALRKMAVCIRKQDVILSLELQYALKKALNIKELEFYDEPDYVKNVWKNPDYYSEFGILESNNPQEQDAYRNVWVSFYKLDSTRDADLILEKESREIIRAIQEGRKKAEFNVEDRIVLGYSGKEDVFAVHQEDIAREVLATTVQKNELTDAEYTNTVDIEGDRFTFWLKRS